MEIVMLKSISRSVIKQLRHFRVPQNFSGPEISSAPQLEERC